MNVFDDAGAHRGHGLRPEDAAGSPQRQLLGGGLPVHAGGADDRREFDEGAGVLLPGVGGPVRGSHGGAAGDGRLRIQREVSFIEYRSVALRTNLACVRGGRQRDEEVVCLRACFALRYSPPTRPHLSWRRGGHPGATRGGAGFAWQQIPSDVALSAWPFVYFYHPSILISPYDIVLK